MDTETLEAALTQKIEEVEKAYQSQSGGEGVCQLHKDGRVSGGLKFEEGRLVALLWARRQILPENSPEYLGLLKTEIRNWQNELQALQQKQSPSLPWLAYRQGGLEALLFAVELVNSSLPGVI